MDYTNRIDNIDKKQNIYSKIRTRSSVYKGILSVEYLISNDNKTTNSNHKYVCILFTAVYIKYYV